MNELQKNGKNNLFSTLETMASEEEQLRYKNAVSFVHIPYELLYQWDGCFIKDYEWFREIWTDQEWEILSSFDRKINRVSGSIPDVGFPDIPEVLENVRWKEIMSLSKTTISQLEIDYQ